MALVLLCTAENTVVGFNMASVKVNEAMGVVNDMVFVEMEGRAEPELMVELLVTGAGEKFMYICIRVVIVHGWQYNYMDNSNNNNVFHYFVLPWNFV